MGSRSNVTLALWATVALAACSESDTSPLPTSTLAMGAPVVSNAQVLVAGSPVQGAVTRGTNEPTLFRVRVQAPGGLPTIRRVVMQYSQPGPNHHGGPMMGGYTGSVLCYDDGTNGDDIPGDGVYHYMDPANQIGCHGVNAPSGEYRYGFWCEDVYGQRSNTASLTVVRP